MPGIDQEEHIEFVQLQKFSPEGVKMQDDEPVIEIEDANVQSPLRRSSRVPKKRKWPSDGSSDEEKGEEIKKPATVKEKNIKRLDPGIEMSNDCNPEIYACTSCDPETFPPTSKYLKLCWHFQKVHSPSSEQQRAKLLRCQVCKETFADPIAIKHHVLSRHQVWPLTQIVLFPFRKTSKTGFY